MVNDTFKSPTSIFSVTQIHRVSDLPFFTFIALSHHPSYYYRSRYEEFKLHMRLSGHVERFSRKRKSSGQTYRLDSVSPLRIRRSRPGVSFFVPRSLQGFLVPLKF